MGKTKADVEHGQKREEIVGVARRLFLEAGYEATSMGRLAEAVGVAPNTIYWYFADKDALLVAVLDDLLAEAVREFQLKKQGPVEAQVMWLLGLLEGVGSLVATVHARAAVSAAVRTWHESFHRMLEATLVVELRGRGVASGDLPHASRVAMFVIEGMLAHPTSTRDRRALVRWVLSKVDERP
jgi:AcrR family transcriptional regulator